MPGPRYPDSAIAPSRHIFLITPHDSNELAVPTKAIRADAAGAVTFRTRDSTADVTMNLAAGERVDADVRYVRDTGTDAIVIHGFG